MIHPPPPAPAERFASVLRALGRAVAAQTLGGPLSQRLICWIGIRITRAIQRIAGLAAQVAAATDTPPRPATAPPPRKPAAGRPRPPPGPAPTQCGWLVPLLPYGGAHRAAFEDLLRDPGLVALMEAAPGPVARVLRPLCWMLAVDLPPALARRRAPESATPPPSRPRRPPRAPPPPTPTATPRPAPALTLEQFFGQVRLVWN